jgi:muconolactone delta-isomerase
MDYFVDMTTQVPPRTPPETVDDIRAREAVRARELAAEGHLKRLWRPPLAPGQWRTFGVFSADDADRLHEVLTSMPLHVWRTDTVTALAQHPNDPGAISGRQAGEYLTTLTVSPPPDTAPETVQDMKAREAIRARELAAQGRLVRLWTLPNEPGQWRTLGLWSADDEAGLTATLESLPLHGWMTVDTTALTPHPSDPARGARR